MENIRKKETVKSLDKREDAISHTRKAIGNNIKDWRWIKGEHPAKNRKLIQVEEGAMPIIKRVYKDNPYT